MTFQHDVTSGLAAPLLEITTQEANVFVSMMPRLRSRVFLSLEEKGVRCQFSMPLWAHPNSRYGNGEGMVKIGVKDGGLKLDVISCRLNGYALPRWLCEQMGRKRFNPEAYWIFDESQIARHLRSIEMRDGLLVVTPLHVE
jgi:hypothetical protein